MKDGWASNGQEFVNTFLNAADKFSKFTPLSCKKCKNTVLILQLLIEARDRKGSLTIDGTTADVMQHREVAYLYICSNCGEVVHLHKIARPHGVQNVEAQETSTGDGSFGAHSEGGGSKQGPA